MKTFVKAKNFVPNLGLLLPLLYSYEYFLFNIFKLSDILP
jgi:hypothetical protein